MKALMKVATAFEDRTGLPGRFILPIALAAIALQVAVVGMYWDIGLHIDAGRDATLFTLPHMLIVVGIQGVVAAALLHGVMPGPRARGERRFLGGRISLAPGGLQMLVCGGVALVAFPLDDFWHRLFGEDATLWGPTHLFMIGGAGMSTLGSWMLLRQARELGRPTSKVRSAQFRAVGGLLIGLSTFQAEFDFGVPQFQLLYQPVLIAFAAGLALVAARSLLGPGGALKALLMYFAIRGALALFVGVGLGYTTPHFALYVAEALVVEGAALVATRSRLRFALLSGAGIGTVGLAAEWGWSHVWMAHPWTPSMLPEAVPLAILAGTGGAVLGARLAQALADPAPAASRRPPIRAAAVALAGVAALLALAVPLPRSGGDGTRATIVPTPAGPGEADLTVTLDPPDAARGAEWFEVLSWQGGEKRRIVDLRQVAPGRYRAAEPVPTSGEWKTNVRLAKGTDLTAVPVYLAPSPVADRAAVPAERRTAELGSETFLLQREARGGPGWLTTLAYSVLAGIVVVWILLTAWSVRLSETRPPEPARRRGGPSRVATA